MCVAVTLYLQNTVSQWALVTGLWSRRKTLRYATPSIQGRQSFNTITEFYSGHDHIFKKTFYIYVLAFD